MPVHAPVYVQNNQDGPTVLATDPKGTIVVEWAGKGDLNGNDIQPIPEEMLNHVAFTRALSRNVLSLLEDQSDPEVVDALHKQQEAWLARTQRSAKVATDAIESATNNDLIQMTCVGPGARGGQCEIQVPVRDREKDTKPVLCDRHKDLAPEYVPEQYQENDKTRTRWVRFAMNPRETQQI